MKRVKVDFSTTVRGGLIRANQRRATPSPLALGEHVEAFDPEEGLSFTGTVTDIDPDGRFAYLRMDWEPKAVRAVPVSTRGANYAVELSGAITFANDMTAAPTPANAPTITVLANYPRQYAQSA